MSDNFRQTTHVLDTIRDPQLQAKKEENGERLNRWQVAAKSQKEGLGKGWKQVEDVNRTRRNRQFPPQWNHPDFPASQQPVLKWVRTEPDFDEYKSLRTKNRKFIKSDRTNGVLEEFSRKLWEKKGAREYVKEKKSRSFPARPQPPTDPKDLEKYTYYPPGFEMWD